MDAEGNQVKDENGEPVPETNARLVKWSDGTESLVLGDKVVDVRKKDMSNEFQALFSFGPTGLDAVDMFDSRMSLQVPSSKEALMQSSFHKDITKRAGINAGKRCGACSCVCASCRCLG